MDTYDEVTRDDFESAGQELAAHLVLHYGRNEAVAILLAALTGLGIVVVYYDDADKRRETPGQPPDTPFPSKGE